MKSVRLCDGAAPSSRHARSLAASLPNVIINRDIHILHVKPASNPASPLFNTNMPPQMTTNPTSRAFRPRHPSVQKLPLASTPCTLAFPSLQDFLSKLWPAASYIRLQIRIQILTMPHFQFLAMISLPTTPLKKFCAAIHDYLPKSFSPLYGPSAAPKLWQL